MEKVKCALCGSEEYTILLSAEDYRYHLTDEIFQLVQCSNCRLVYLNPRPRKKVINFYPKQYYNHNRLARAYGKLLQIMKVHKLMSIRKKRGRMLDIGCGDGQFLYSFKARGWEIYGIDPSENAYKIAKKNLGENVFKGELEDVYFSDCFFDIIALNHVLEHIVNPNKELGQIRRILKNDGILFLSTPNIHSFQFKISREYWFALDLPRHLFLFSPKTLRMLLEKNGFKVVKISYPMLDFPLSLFYSLKAKWFNKKSKFKMIVMPLLFIASPLTKLLPSYRVTMDVIAQKMRG